MRKLNELDKDTYERLDNIIAKAAAYLFKQYKPWVEAEDVRQEMWVWALPRLNRLEKLNDWQAQRDLQDAAETYCRKEKATRSGYDPDDEVFYSQRVIRELLPYAVREEPIISRGTDDSTVAGAKRAGAESSMEVETTVIDLRKAFKKLPPWQRRILTEYVDGEDVNQGNVWKAIQSMQRKLGGRRPQTWK